VKRSSLAVVQNTPHRCTIPEHDLSRLVCPIGIPSLKSKAPAVIAVALAAELLQLTEDPAA